MKNICQVSIILDNSSICRMIFLYRLFEFQGRFSKIPAWARSLESNGNEATAGSVVKNGGRIIILKFHEGLGDRFL